MTPLYHYSLLLYHVFVFFFFNDTATTEIYTLSLHDALPISAAAYVNRDIKIACSRQEWKTPPTRPGIDVGLSARSPVGDRKSTRLNSSHSQISYAVFCLKKKKKKNNTQI